MKSKFGAQAIFGALFFSFSWGPMVAGAWAWQTNINGKQENPIDD